MTASHDAAQALCVFDEKKRFMLALIAPAVLVLVFFQILPILTGTNASFRDWHLHDPKKTWIGLTNYAYVLRDGEFLRTVLPNTFGFMFASVGCSLVLGLADRAAAQPQVPRPLAGADHHPAAADGGARHRRHHDPLDVQRPVRHRQRDPRTCSAYRRSPG